MMPSLTVSIHAFSSASANLINSGVSSSFPRWISPRVQAKIEAMGLVDVSLPFWCSRQWRVTVPWAGYKLDWVAREGGGDLTSLGLEGLSVGGN